MIDFKRLVREQSGLVSKLRRDLHRIPETAYTEEKTSRYVADFLMELGLEVKTGIARHGVTALLRSAHPGKTLMIRADMDALEISEETGLDFASTHGGLMHACGHDAHMSMALVTAKILNEMKEHLKGNIKFLFQPAEEGPGGAGPMIEEGVMEDPIVDYAVGCPCMAGNPGGDRRGEIRAFDGRHGSIRFENHRQGRSWGHAPLVRGCPGGGMSGGQCPSAHDGQSAD